MPTRTLSRFLFGAAAALIAAEAMSIAYAAYTTNGTRIRAYFVVTPARGEELLECLESDLLAVAEEPAASVAPEPAPEAAAPRDREAPSIGRFDIGVAPGGARISWEDSERTRSWLYFEGPAHVGASTDDPLDLSWTSTRTDGEFASRHTVALDGLTPGARYRFAVESVDAAGNTSASEPFEFVAGTI